MTEHPREARDWAADLALCELATPPPWYASNPDDEQCMNAYAVSTVPGEPDVGRDERENDHGVIVALTLLQSPRVVDHEAGRWQHDAEFIAAAREGWPAALRRVLALEAENARLRQACEIFEKNSAGAAALFEALAYYAEPAHYRRPCVDGYELSSKVDSDRGQRARTAMGRNEA